MIDIPLTPGIHVYGCTKATPLPLESPLDWSLRQRPGMGDQFVLFSAPKSGPIPWLTEIGCASRADVQTVSATFAGLRRQLVRVCDGIVTYEKALVLDCRSSVTPMAGAVGGNVTGDGYVLTTLWLLLLPKIEEIAGP